MKLPKYFTRLTLLVCFCAVSSLASPFPPGFFWLFGFPGMPAPSSAPSGPIDSTTYQEVGLGLNAPYNLEGVNYGEDSEDRDVDVVLLSQFGALRPAAPPSVSSSAPAPPSAPAPATALIVVPTPVTSGNPVTTSGTGAPVPPTVPVTESTPPAPPATPGPEAPAAPPEEPVLFAGFSPPPSAPPNGPVAPGLGDPNPISLPAADTTGGGSNTPLVANPEPSTMLLLLGGLGIAVSRRRRQSSSR